MMKICIDITEMTNVKFVSGIQRVVREVTTRWIQSGYDLVLLYYNINEKCFFVIDNKKYADYYTGKSGKKRFVTNKKFTINDFNKNMVFFDMDSVWMNPLKRSWLLPVLKKNKTKIATHVYDIIPITNAQYCHEFTIFNFCEYIGAHLQFSDLIIANAEATINAINYLIEGTNVASINGHVIKLGSDIIKEDSKLIIRSDIKNIINRGRYVLMVGTLEPRKNHSFVLDAFDKCLFEEDLNLVFVGRIGWNVQSLIERIQNHSRLNTQLFFINDANDLEVSSLYTNCLCVAFPSYNEGFGLPIIEAFSHNALVVANDIPVLHEVGGDYCKYFSVQNDEEFISTIKLYKENIVEYTLDKEKIMGYKPIAWDQCAEEMIGVLRHM